MPAIEPIALNLGSEHDAALLSRVKSAVAALGGSIGEASYAVVGSQELIEFEVKLPSGNLALISETYIGLTLKGPPELVGQVVNALPVA